MKPKSFRRLNETAYRVLAGLREQATPMGGAGGFGQTDPSAPSRVGGVLGRRPQRQHDQPQMTTRALSGGIDYPFEPSAEWLAEWQAFLDGGNLKAGMPEGLFPPDMVGVGPNEIEMWWSFIGWFSTTGLQQWVDAGGQIPPGLTVNFGGSDQSFEDIINTTATHHPNMDWMGLVSILMFGQLPEGLGGGSVYTGNGFMAEMYEFFQFIFNGSGWVNPWHSQ